MAHAILPDPYWAGMILGRLVHQHVTLVERQLLLDHRDAEQALLQWEQAASGMVSRLDGLQPRDRVMARLWLGTLGQPLLETILLPESFAANEVPTSDGGPALSLLVFGDRPGAPVLDGMTKVLVEVDQLALGPILRLGLGLAGTDEVPHHLATACELEAVLLPPQAWTLPPRELAELVLAAAARSLAGLWARAEARAYALAKVPDSATMLAADFATGVVSEARRRAAALDSAAHSAPRQRFPEPDVESSPAQDEVLPLTSELVRCWWPTPGRAQNIFDSPFDYMNTLEPIHASG